MQRVLFLAKADPRTRGPGRAPWPRPGPRVTAYGPRWRALLLRRPAAIRGPDGCAAPPPPQAAARLAARPSLPVPFGPGSRTAPPLYGAGRAACPRTALAVPALAWSFPAGPWLPPPVRRQPRDPPGPAPVGGAGPLPPAASRRQAVLSASRPVGRARAGDPSCPSPGVPPTPHEVPARALSCRPLSRQPGAPPFPRPTHVGGANPRATNNFSRTFFKKFCPHRRALRFRR
ncbi:MAG: hypothetical protein JWO75_5153 [Actinomycetia bacterium]|nr:hypothetical protein [Actinomycetes bacterium]